MYRTVLLALARVFYENLTYFNPLFWVKLNNGSWLQLDFKQLFVSYFMHFKILRIFGLFPINYLSHLPPSITFSNKLSPFLKNVTFRNNIFLFYKVTQRKWSVVVPDARHHIARKKGLLISHWAETIGPCRSTSLLFVPSMKRVNFLYDVFTFQ